MFFKKILDIGLVGKIANCINEKVANDGTFGEQIDCTLGRGVLPSSLRKWCFYAQSISYFDPQGIKHFEYEKAYPNFRKLLNGLTDQVSEAQRKYPQFQYIRRFYLPSKEHKVSYVYERNIANEDWLETAISDAGNRIRSFQIEEEFINGSWTPKIQTYGMFGFGKEKYSSIPPNVAKRFIEKAFSPFKCVVEIRLDGIVKYAHYELIGSDKSVLKEGKIYLFEFDQEYQLVAAVKFEKEEIKKTGISFPETDFDDDPSYILEKLVEDEEYRKL